MYLNDDKLFVYALEEIILLIIWRNITKEANKAAATL